MKRPFLEHASLIIHIGRQFRAICGLFGRAALGAVVVCSVAGSVSSRAQSDNPSRLREIIDRLNAQAAQATWGDQNQQAFPTPPSNSPSSPPSGSRGGGSTSSNPSTSSGGFGSFTSGTNDAGSSSSPSQPDTTQGPYAPAMQADPEPAVASSSAADTVLPAPVSVESAPAMKPTTLARRATVSYAAGLLTIQADNSSLNQILRQVSRLTGTVITGGVAEERVFGHYGPAKPAAVLSSLLGGTDSGVLMRGRPDGSVAELILKPHDSVTVPCPSDSVFDTEEERDAHSHGSQVPVSDKSLQAQAANQSSVSSPPLVPQH